MSYCNQSFIVFSASRFFIKFFAMDVQEILGYVILIIIILFMCSLCFVCCRIFECCEKVNKCCEEINKCDYAQDRGYYTELIEMPTIYRIRIIN